jgi:hypothetical protein
VEIKHNTTVGNKFSVALRKKIVGAPFHFFGNGLATPSFTMPISVSYFETVLGGNL